MNSYSINKILVPVDLSQTSLNALDTGVEMAKKHKATLQILNVVETGPDSFSEEGSFFGNQHLFGSSDVLSALAGAIQHKVGINPDIIQEEGNVTDTIIKTSLANQNELIVMGSHGASGYRDGFIGSNAYSVMKQANCPVLTIPSNKKFISFKNALFPIRPVTGALMRYDVLCHFLSANGSIDVLGLSYRKMERETNVLEKIVDEIKDKLDTDKISAKASWGTGISIGDDVLYYAQKNNSELIVLTSVLDVTTKANFIGPHTQKIINCAKIPVLSIKKLGVSMYA